MSAKHQYESKGLRLRSLIGASALALVLAGCAAEDPDANDVYSDNSDIAAPSDPVGGKSATDEMSDVRALHERLIVMDSHLDTPALLVRPGFDIMERHDPLIDYSQVDLPRMIEGGLDGGFWVIYSPQGPLTEKAYQGSRDTAILRSLAIHKMVAAYPDHFELALKSEDAARIESEGKRIVFQSIENSYPLGEDVSLLETFYKLGVRMVGPVHFRNNQFADSGTDIEGQDWGGLSPLGEELVREANRLGMILDASHAHDETFDDMVELSATPIILSHSGAKALYDHPRNLDDERLKKLAETGGLIQMNALGAYLKALQTAPERRDAMQALFAEMGDPDTLSEEQYEKLLEKRREIDKQYPADMADFEDFMEQFIYTLKLIGPDHVGVGADWDGGGGVVGMRDISAFPLITERLLEEGYTEEDLYKIWGGNLIRLMKNAEDYAASLKAAATEEPVED